MPQTTGKPHGHSNGAMFPKAWSAHSSGRDARRRSVWIILSVRRISLGGAGMDASNPSRRPNRRVHKVGRPGAAGLVRGGGSAATRLAHLSAEPTSLHGFFNC